MKQLFFSLLLTAFFVLSSCSNKSEAPKQEQANDYVKFTDRIDLPNGNYILQDRWNDGLLFSADGKQMIDTVMGIHVFNDTTILLESLDDFKCRLIDQNGKDILAKEGCKIYDTDLKNILEVWHSKQLFSLFDLSTMSFLFKDVKDVDYSGTSNGKFVFSTDKETYYIDSLRKVTKRNYVVLCKAEDCCSNCSFEHFIKLGKNTYGITDLKGKMISFTVNAPENEDVILREITAKYIVIELYEADDFLIFNHQGQKLGTANGIKNYLLGSKEFHIFNDAQKVWEGSEHTVVLIKNTYYVYKTKTGEFFTTTYDRATAELYTE